MNALLIVRRSVLIMTKQSPIKSSLTDLLFAIRSYCKAWSRLIGRTVTPVYGECPRQLLTVLLTVDRRFREQRPKKWRMGYDFCPSAGRRLIRNQQVDGSNPPASSKTTRLSAFR